MTKPTTTTNRFRQLMTPNWAALHPRRAVLAMAVAIAAAGCVALEHGFYQTPVPRPVLVWAQLLLPWLALWIGGHVLPNRLPMQRWANPVGLAGEGLVMLCIVGHLSGWTWTSNVLPIVAAIAFSIRANGVLSRSLKNPQFLFPVSFLLIIVLSTALLKLPTATPEDEPIGWIDALFTATSAVCVTGLGVRDTASGFTPVGQAILLGSIQVGGLGVMIFGSTLALLFGARMSVKENVTLSAALDEYPAHRIMRFAWFIVFTTLLFELLGGIVLYALWPEDGLNGNPRWWVACFHSISAFCNAGFDVTGQSMIGLRTHWAAYLGIVPLIVVGGLGFIVLEDLYQWVWHHLWGRLSPKAKRLVRKLPWLPAHLSEQHAGVDTLHIAGQLSDNRKKTVRVRGRDGQAERLSTHTKITLVTTLCLLVGGAATMAVAQATDAGQWRLQNVLDGVFMSTSARTAGFTSLPMDELSPGSRFVTMVLMAIGGSPGSTAGGMKTVVFAVLVLAVVSTVRGREEVEAFGRSLSDALIKKAATVAAGLFGVIVVATLILDITEQMPFETIFFEVISAASTTGLSLNATGDLSPAGRLTITVAMFLGRVGTLSLLSSLLGAGLARGRYHLPRDSVSLG